MSLFLLVLCQMRDTLPILARPSKKMQSQDTDLSCLEVDIPDAIAGDTTTTTSCATTTTTTTTTTTVTTATTHITTASTTVYIY